MGLREIFLAIAALLPAFALCVYVYKKDRVEKEPLLFLLILLLYGAFSCLPVMVIGPVIEDIIDKLFSAFIYVNEDGKRVMAKSVYYIYNFTKYTVGVGLIEEGGKAFWGA